MNHFLSTYVDFIQSIGLMSIFAFVSLAIVKLFSDNKKENYIKVVKVRVDE